MIGSGAKVDAFNLRRFVDAQNAIFGQVIAELKAGQKRTHWMWFVFPQVSGLGRTAITGRFAISSREEAEAYLAHPLLASRLRECTTLVNCIEGRSIEDIFKHPDYLKFHSSMTLFAEVAHDDLIFTYALDKFFDGVVDPQTIFYLRDH